MMQTKLATEQVDPIYNPHIVAHQRKYEQWKQWKVEPFNNPKEAHDRFRDLLDQRAEFIILAKVIRKHSEGY